MTRFDAARAVDNAAALPTAATTTEAVNPCATSPGQLDALSTQADFPDPVGYSFTSVGPLKAGQALQARQIVDGVPGPWASATVIDFHDLYPAGLPRPQISPDPVYECGSRTGAGNLLTGCNAWITADGVEVGRQNGATAQQGINVNPDYGLAQRVRAGAELCGEPSPPSVEYLTGAPPNPVPAPGVDPVYAGAERIAVNALVNGARFTVERGGAVLGPIRTWGIRHFVGASPAATEGEKILVAQTMCPFNPPSPPGVTVVEACAAMPAPEVAPIQAGDTAVTVTGWAAGARIKVYQNGVKIGDGGPPVVATKPIAGMTPVYVQQIVGSCVGARARQVDPRCVAPPVGADPAGLDLFPVGELDFWDGADVRGSVFYPAEDDGPGQPFNQRLAKLRRCPIVFLAHGNHATVYDPADRNREDCTAAPG